jgi:hypothetical protein
MERQEYIAVVLFGLDITSFTTPKVDLDQTYARTKLNAGGRARCPSKSKPRSRSTPPAKP